MGDETPFVSTKRIANASIEIQMMQFHTLVRENAQELAELIVRENGKNITEALADGERV